MANLGGSVVHVVSKPPSRDHFWRVQAPTDPHKYIFGQTFYFPRVRKSTLGALFLQKGSKGEVDLVRGSVLAATLLFDKP